MKQILQNLGNGETILAEVPCPQRGSGSVLIQTTRTLVSLGTEKMLIDFGKGSWLAKVFRVRFPAFARGSNLVGK